MIVLQFPKPDPEPKPVRVTFAVTVNVPADDVARISHLGPLPFLLGLRLCQAGTVVIHDLGCKQAEVFVTSPEIRSLVRKETEEGGEK